MPPRLAIVVPVLDEAAGIVDTLSALAPLRAAGVEVVVADGGSSDGTPSLAAPGSDRVIAAPRGRARQMNAGAAASRAPRLLFLHADTTLPAGALELVERALAGPARWGRFDVHIVGRSAMLPLVATMMNLRSRLTGIATGDQAIFVTRAEFEAVGGFPDQPLMEDIELPTRLRRRSAPACLRAKVRTSGRRWDRHGAWRTIRLMWWLRWLYFTGTPAERLAAWYR